MAHYEGEPVTRWLKDGRRVQLLEPFAFVDDAGLRWEVPSHAIVDGASIPKPLWSLIGGPFEGPYRDASIVHDWYCDVRSRPWRDVHRMFHAAMIASAVSPYFARLLYAGVYMGGPRWSETTVANAALATDDYLKASQPGSRTLHFPQPADPRRDMSGYAVAFPRPDSMVTKVYRFDVDAADIERLKTLAEDDADLDAIEAAVDERVGDRAETVLKVVP